MGFIENPPYNPPFEVWFEVPNKWDMIKRLEPIEDIVKAVAVAKKLSTMKDMDSIYIEEKNGRLIWENC